MSEREVRFEAHTAKRRQRTIGVTVLILLVGYIRDTHSGGGFPSAATIAFAVLAFLALEIHAAFRSARALNISDSGIALERTRGGKMARFAWHEIKRAEARRSITGLVWTFHMKDGEEIRWAQSDFDGDQRLELEKMLRRALQQHGVPFK